MVNFEIDIGLASLYFITDIDKGICDIKSPHLLLAKDILGLDDLVNFLSIAWVHPPRWNIFAKKPDKHKIEQLLTGLISQKPPSVSPAIVNIPYPIFAFAKQIEAKTLNAMKVLKVRGICLISAIAFNDQPADILYQLEREYKNDLIYHNSDMSCLGYKPIKNLYLVSGIDKTLDN